MDMKPMSLFGIEPFEVQKRRNTSTVQMTVRPYEIIIPMPTYERFGRPQFVEVGFNEDKRFFGIKPCKTETKFSIEILTKSTSRYIARVAIVDKIHSLRPWDMNSYNLILDKGEYDAQSGYWLFDLDACKEVSFKTRRPNRRK